MPIYEYECTVCGYQFEKRMKMDDPNPPCPKPTSLHMGSKGIVTEPGQDIEVTVAPLTVCGGTTRKLMSRTSFVLVGGGWAADGYSSGGGKKG